MPILKIQFMSQQAMYIAWGVSNVIALFILLMAFKRPFVAKLLLSLIFLWAAFINSYNALLHPEVYLDYAKLTPVKLYREIIEGPFSKSITGYVILIAVCQFLIALFTGHKGILMKAAMWGAIVFLIAIAPFGIGSGFPCTLVMALSYYILLKKKKDHIPFMDFINHKILKGKIT